ncbi:LysR family transcriptional regulator [Phytohabitans kaempferiae]|uniref:LysR family transcriptional regulator n=1 Tax=Phytohabitans kaempferiae TaxID=1620943 RepID=A0ABV6M5G9_9ACTN
MFDAAHLRSFLAVAQSLSFTQAARRLDLRQSTVSQHVQRLEAAVGRRLLDRDTHGVALTADGEAMVGFATAILEVGERAMRHFAGPPLHGVVRFGVSEDLVQTDLPEILRAFSRSHPGVELDLTVALSGSLHQRLAGGDLDLVLAKRVAGDQPGQVVWRDRFVWVGAPDVQVDPARPVPLVAYPPPSISRARAIAALTAAGREWRLACVSGSLGGLRAAALAGQGVLAHTAGLVPSGLVRLGARAGLPDLGEVEFVLMGREDGAAGALGTAIRGHGRWRLTRDNR